MTTFAGNKKPNYIVILVVLAILVLAALAAVIYFKPTKVTLSDTTSVTTEEQAKIEQAKITVSKIKQILLVEGTEDPAVAEIKDVEIVKKSNPEFYKNANNGDKLVAYSYRAIIFRESANQIINVAPIVNTASSSSAAAKPAASAAPAAPVAPVAPSSVKK